MNKFLIFLLLMMPAFGFQGAVKPPSGAAAHKRAVAAGNAPAASDAVISATIKQKLAKSKIGKNGFTYKVSGGVVTWEGKTDIVQHKGSATRMANSSGAKAVVNNIQISDAAKAKATANLDAGRRRAQVTRSQPRSMMN